ncbi:MAG: Asp-tRNA(Asn)/Glu-tRNA(Gln) amidotransferase subunit GatB [Deltaproteobacteria bacterium]|nr:Asp-tRNA(Asn)/Glu-tRNA(Gln) amidotransferase subunit GatB [Deltaproteobacteria bacterium]
MNYEPVIGLEVHAQLLTQSKLFCGCPTTFGAPPNTNICPVCTGQPGALPVLNRTAVEFAIRAGLALQCTIAPRSVFARKNYFYPDLPKGYQISQYERPLCEHGFLDCDLDGATKRITIQRIHMEEDAGKLLHDAHDRYSHVDLNRSSVPLIEIVSGPDLRSTAEATAYLKQLRNILMYLRICDGNMQEGSLRCDANISMRPVGSKAFGTRTELKNLNSFRFLEHAITYEMQRQIAVLEAGGRVEQETRLWDEAAGRSASLRSKEEAHDYRYFPDPDLCPLQVEAAWLEAIRGALPELPQQKMERYVRALGLSEYDARVLTADQQVAHFFEAAIGHHASPKALCNWITSELQGRLNAANLDIAQAKITPAHLATLVKRIEDGTITGKMAKGVFEVMYQDGADPETIIQQQGLKQVSDPAALEPVIDAILAANAANVAAYRAGKTNLLAFFIGQVMKQTKGQANPQLLQALLKKKLG